MCISHLFLVLNSAINILVYCVLSTKFREEACKMWKKITRKYSKTEVLLTLLIWQRGLSVALFSQSFMQPRPFSTHSLPYGVATAVSVGMNEYNLGAKVVWICWKFGIETGKYWNTWNENVVVYMCMCRCHVRSTYCRDPNHTSGCPLGILGFDVAPIIDNSG